MARVVGHADGFPVETVLLDPNKVSDMDKIAEQITAAKGTPNFDVLIQTYCGPGMGLKYNDETCKCEIASSWTVNADGVIVRK